MHGWGPSPDRSYAYEEWGPWTHQVAPVSGGGTLTLPETHVATPRLLYFRANREGPRVPFLVTDPELPRMGTAAPVRDPTVTFEFDDSPRPEGYFFYVRARSAPGDSYVLGRGSTPGFVLGALPNPAFGPDSFVVAALSPDGGSLSPPIPIHAIPVESVLGPSDVREPLFTEHDLECAELDFLLDDLAANPVLLTDASVAGPRTVEVTGYGLTAGMRVVFRVHRLRDDGGIEATARLTDLQPLAHRVDPAGCHLNEPVPQPQRARVVYTMEPGGWPFARIVWRTRPDAPERRD